MFLSRTSIAEAVLRLGLAGMYLWSGIDILRHPEAWDWAIRSLPDFVQNPIIQFGIERYLMFQGIGEIVIAAIFLAWFMPKFIVRIAGLVSAIEMISIVFLVGLDAVTFRDIGLAGAGLAIFFMAKR